MELTKSQRYYLENRERLLANCRRYQKAHPDVVKRAQAKYHKKHAVRLRQKRRETWPKRRAKAYVAHRKWVERNKKARLQYMRAWREAHAVERREYDRQYRANHLAQRAHRQNAREARKVGNGGSHTWEQWAVVMDEYGQACVYCGAGGRMSKDHIVALVNGGTDDIANIVPACLACNRIKHSKSPEDFIDILFGL